MAVYKFKVTFEDYDDVFREIEIKSNQTFEDLHTAILSAVGFDNKHTASFYISDDFWHKGQEITLSISEKELQEEEDRRPKKKKLPKLIMKEAKLLNYMEDPHQKFIYIYDPHVQWSFFIELTKILIDDAKVNYPRCVKSTGEAPKQYKTKDTIALSNEDAALADELEPSDEEVLSESLEFDETEDANASSIKDEDEVEGEGSVEESEEGGEDEDDFKPSYGSGEEGSNDDF